MPTSTKSRSGPRRMLSDYALYAPIGAGQLVVEKTREASKKAWTVARKSAKGRHNGKAPSRVAVISLHTSPRAQPGSGDSGGMNVYVLSVARRLAEQGIAVDIYTRCHGQGGPDVEEIAPGTHLVNVQAGPCAPVAKDDLPRLLPEFLDGVLQHARADDPPSHRPSPYDVVPSHYRPSGWVGGQDPK